MDITEAPKLLVKEVTSTTENETMKVVVRTASIFGANRLAAEFTAPSLYYSVAVDEMGDLPYSAFTLTTVVQQAVDALWFSLLTQYSFSSEYLQDISDKLQDALDAYDTTDEKIFEAWHLGAFIKLGFFTLPAKPELSSLVFSAAGMTAVWSGPGASLTIKKVTPTSKYSVVSNVNGTIEEHNHSNPFANSWLVEAFTALASPA